MSERKEKFTPGPWCPQHLFHVLRHARKNCDFDDTILVGHHAVTESEEDCDLACAAPELYAVIVGFVEKYDAMQDGNIGAQFTPGDFFAARAALAKARGDQ